MREFCISEIDFQPVDVALEDEFVISQGTLHAAELLYVRVRLESAVCGYGEMAPFPALTQENRSTTQRIAHKLADYLYGKSVQHYRALSITMAEMAPDHPAARCGLETAILDAYTRSLGIPMWGLWGAAGIHEQVQTDITLPILSEQRSLELARAWYQKGFRRLKTKVGTRVTSDVSRILAIASELPDVEFVLDANQGFTSIEAVDFVRRLREAHVRIALFEQPVHKDDLPGMAFVRLHCDVPVAADESVSSAADAMQVIGTKAADVINLKIMKSGLREALDIASLTRAAGLDLMIGGMLESRLAMACSLAIVFGRGDIRYVDLDTPLLMAEDPIEGGYSYRGPVMSLWSEPGLGMIPRVWA